MYIGLSFTPKVATKSRIQYQRPSPKIFEDSLLQLWNRLCGGANNSSKSCIFYRGKDWEPYSFELIAERNGHVSWARPNGRFYLMGGWDSESYISGESEIESSTSTEIIPQIGSSKESTFGFELEYPTM